MYFLKSSNFNLGKIYFVPNKRLISNDTSLNEL